jgi:hypothetical protein
LYGHGDTSLKNKEKTGGYKPPLRNLWFVDTFSIVPKLQLGNEETLRTGKSDRLLAGQDII